MRFQITGSIVGIERWIFTRTRRVHFQHAEVRLQVLVGTGSLMTADYMPQDGIVDLFVGFWYKSYGGSHVGVQARLFKGKGDGTFVDATPGSGLETQPTGYDQGKNHRPAYGVTSCDLDDDGNPELMVSAYGRQ